MSEVSLELDRQGTDLLVDAGRLGHANEPLTLIRRADVVAVVLQATLRSVVGATRRVAAASRPPGPGLGSGGRPGGGGGSYSYDEVRHAIELDHLVEVHRDSRTAAILAGTAPGAPSRAARF